MITPTGWLKSSSRRVISWLQHDLRFADVGRHDVGELVVLQQHLALRDRDRLVVHVHHARLRIDPLRDLVHVAHGRDA